MADISDVMGSLVTIANNAVYPNGIGSPSVALTDCIIYQGWPTAATLDADLIVGKCHVTVYPRPEERNTTRYPLEWQDQTINPKTITLTIAGQTVTVGGTITVPQACVVTVNGTLYSYKVLITDTLSTIATGIAALISGASAVGAVVTIPSAKSLAAAVSVGGTALKEIRRQERVFQITVWANTPSNRDTLASAIDVALAQSERLTLSDQTVAHVVYKGSPMTDDLQKAKLYRRDLMYTVEFATTITMKSQTVVGTVVNTTSQQTGTPLLQPPMTVSNL